MATVIAEESVDIDPRLQELEDMRRAIAPEVLAGNKSAVQKDKAIKREIEEFHRRKEIEVLAEAEEKRRAEEARAAAEEQNRREALRALAAGLEERQRSLDDIDQHVDKILRIVEAEVKRDNELRKLANRAKAGVNPKPLVERLPVHLHARLGEALPRFEKIHRYSERLKEADARSLQILKDKVRELDKEEGR